VAYQSKDFVETADGLLFAVVSDRLEQDKLLCFLRYVKRNGQWCKLNTEQAYAHLNIHFPDYLYHSMQLDVALHAVSEAKIIQHFQPKVVLRQLLDGSGQDNVVRDFQGLCQWLRGYQLDLDQFGVTGSLLLGLQNPASDMDLVCYDRDVFQQARQVIQSMIANNQCQNLSQADWLKLINAGVAILLWMNTFGTNSVNLTKPYSMVVNSIYLCWRISHRLRSATIKKPGMCIFGPESSMIVWPLITRLNIACNILRLKLWFVLPRLMPDRP
jgi:hypothetical protein